MRLYCPTYFDSKKDLVESIKKDIVGNATSYEKFDNHVFIPFVSKKIQSGKSAYETGRRIVEDVNKLYKGDVTYLDATPSDGVNVVIRIPKEYLIERIKAPTLRDLAERMSKLYDRDIGFYKGDYALLEQENKQDSNLGELINNTSIKPGVPELFESNQTLANSVYEAAGIRNPNITVLPNGNLKIVAFRTEKVGPTSKGEYQRGKGLYLSLDRPYSGEDVYTVEIEISPKNLLDRKLGFGEISEDYFIDEKNKRVDKQLDTLHEFKQSLGIKAEIGSIDGALMNELVLFDKELIDKALASKQVYNPQQKQQAQQLYSQYLDSLNKPNTNPILKDNQQEQVKKFAELQERLNNKEFLEGAKFAYENSEGLKSFGTQEQYNDYIARVSLGIIKNPSSGEYNYTSKVKDIVYHGTNDVNFTPKENEQGIHFGFKKYVEEWMYRTNALFNQRYYKIKDELENLDEGEYDVELASQNTFDLNTFEGRRSYTSFKNYMNSLNISDIKQEFNISTVEDLNKLLVSKGDALQKALINKAKQRNPGIKVEFSEAYEGNAYNLKENTIYVSLKEAYALSKVNGKSFEDTLVALVTHEYIHAGIEKVLQSDTELKKEFEILHQEFLNNIKNKNFVDSFRVGLKTKEGFYQENLSEFIADLGNPYFREYLEETDFWTRFKNLIKKAINSLLGTNLKVKESLLDRLVEKYYSTKIDNSFLNQVSNETVDYENKVFRAVPDSEDSEDNSTKEFKHITGKFKQQIVALQKRLANLKNSRDKETEGSPERLYYDNLINKLQEGLDNLTDSNRRDTVYELGKEVLEQAEGYIKSLENGTKKPTEKHLKYINELVHAFYPSIKSGDPTGLETKAIELARRLDEFRKKIIEDTINEYSTKGDIKYSEIESQNKDITSFERWLGALSDLGNYIGSTIGAIIKEAQNKITVESKKAAHEIQKEVDALKEWGKKNGVSEQDIYNIFIQEHKGTLVLTRPRFENGDKNPNYEKIQTTKELRDFFKFYQRIVSEATSKLPVELGVDFIPNVQRSMMDELQGKGVIEKLGVLKDSVKDLIKYKEYDLKSDAKSEDLYSDKISLKYIKKLAPDEKSRDLGYNLLEYVKFANEYAEMSEVLPQVRLLQNEIASKEYRKSGSPDTAIAGEHSNLYKMVDDYINMQVKGISKKDELKVSVHKDLDEEGNIKKEKFIPVSEIIDLGLKYNSLLRIGLNPFNAVSNVFIGKLGNIIESVGGAYFNFRELNRANTIVAKGFMNEDSDFNKAIEELNPLQEFEEYQVYNQIKLNSKNLSPNKAMDLAYSPQRLGEKYLQGQTMIAVLLHDGLMDTSGKFTDRWYSLSTKDKSQLTDKIQRINQMIHGRYSSRDAAAAQQYVIYRMISQFRKWIPAAIEARFGGKKYDSRLGREVEGRYNAYKKGWDLYLLGLKSFVTKVELGEYSETDLYNMRKNLFEAALIFGSILLYGGLKGDDDDKEFRSKPIVKFALNQLNRVSGDLLYFYNPKEINKLGSRAIPLTKTIGDLIRVGEYIPYAFYNYDSKGTYKSGPHKGGNKFYSSLPAILPGFRPIQEVFETLTEDEYKEPNTNLN